MAKSQSISLEVLMSEAKAGNSKAYHQVLVQSEVIIRSYIAPRLSKQSDLDDLVQEILISIHKAKRSYDEGRPFKPWLYAIAKFRLYDFLRKNYNDEKKMDALWLESKETACEMDAMAHHKYEPLMKAIEELPEKQQMLVTKSKLEGYSYKEVAKMMNMSETAAKVMAHRVYKVLRKKLEHDYV